MVVDVVETAVSDDVTDVDVLAVGSFAVLITLDVATETAVFDVVLVMVE